ncbi:MAG: N-acetyltransferase [Acidimicrobiia bacterium]|nr:N-acetyltransferase [Acidimicrobiia bacterium]
MIDNLQAGRFELHVDGELRSFANYRERSGALVVPHVETIRRYRGNGFAERLMDGVVKDLRETGRRIVDHRPCGRSNRNWVAVRLGPNVRIGRVSGCER